MSVNDSLPIRRPFRVLRLLTLASFIHFSGVHNGCTALLSASPLNVRQSVSLAGGIFGNFQILMTPRQVLSSLEQGRARILTVASFLERSARNACRAAYSAFSSVKVRMGADPNLLGMPAGSPSWERSQIFSWKRETWINPKANPGRPAGGRWLKVNSEDSRTLRFQTALSKAADFAHIDFMRKMFRRQAGSSGDRGANAEAVSGPTLLTQVPPELGFFI